MATKESTSTSVEAIRANAAHVAMLLDGHLGCILTAMHDLAVQHENGVSSDTLSVCVEELTIRAKQVLEDCRQKLLRG